MRAQTRAAVYGCFHKLRLFFVGFLIIRAKTVFGSIFRPLIFGNSDGSAQQVSEVDMAAVVSEGRL